MTCRLDCCERLLAVTFAAGNDGNSLCDIITYHESVQAGKELGLQLTTVQETLVDMAVTLMQLGIAVPRPTHAQ